MNASFAPYNFIPFSQENTPKPYKSREDLPGFDRADGAYTGRIAYDVRTLTGLSVGGNRPAKSDKKEVTDGTFCTDGNGNYIIPGSTMRGFFRSHVEILSNSEPDMIGDNRYMFRTFADKSKKARKEYTNKLKKSAKNTLGIPDGVKAGFIYKEKLDGTDTYYMMPAKKFGDHDSTFFQVHESDLRKAGVLAEKQYMYQQQFPKYHGNGSRSSLEYYNQKLTDMKNPEYKPYKGTEVSFDYTDRVCNLGEGSMKGILLNSEWIEGKTHHYIVSAEKGTSAFVINKKEILTYQNDYERNCIQNKELAENQEFYGLPGDYGIANAKLFFYKKAHVSGKMIGFGPTPYFRIFYDYGVEQGIPKSPEAGYDYTKAMFGFSQGTESYKSRLSFSNCKIRNKNAHAEQVKLYAGAPRGTAFQMYLEQEGKEVETLNTYNDKEMRLRGYKFYWKRITPVSGLMDQTLPNTSISVIGARKLFHGQIYFENLRKDELGLLLCALQIDPENQSGEKETYQIGNGKAYGYGKIALENIRLFQIDPKQRFTSLNVTEKDITDQMDELRAYYKQVLKTDYQIDINTDASLQIYQKLAHMPQADEYLSTHRQPYMTLDEYKSRQPLPTADAVITGRYKKMMEEEQAARKKDCIWTAKYRLSSEQESKLKKLLPHGASIEKKNEWLKKEQISQYAAEYSSIAVPSKTKSWLLDLLKESFDHVYLAVAENEIDVGWKQLR